MEELTDPSAVLLLERPHTPIEPLRFDLQTGRNSLSPSTVRNQRGRAGAEHGQAPEDGPAFRSPALVLLASFSILESYARLGVIQVHHSRMAAILVSRPGAVAYAVTVMSVALLLTRPPRGLHRPMDQKLVVGASTSVPASAILLFVSSTSWASHVFGVANLFVAAAAAGVVVIMEHRKHRHEQLVSQTLLVSTASDLHATALQG